MKEAKRQLVQSWLTKAQHDLAAADVLSQSVMPLLDTAIYHCQQAAEKSLKGYLVYCDQELERVHDVEALIRAALPYEAMFSVHSEAGRLLTPYSRIFRYPGYAIEPSEDQFAQAYASATAIYHFVLSLLPADAQPLPLQGQVVIETNQAGLEAPEQSHWTVTEE
jgi:HEPN domain-containing protein